MAPPRALLLYDGTCALCDGTVRFLLRIDRRRALHFAPLAGPTADAVRQRHPALAGVDSVALVGGAADGSEAVSVRSNAVLGALVAVGGAWRAAAAAGRLVPRPLRDWAYDRIAARRKRWFGVLDSCPLPAPEHRGRFLP